MAQFHALQSENILFIFKVFIFILDGCLEGKNVPTYFLHFSMV